MRTRMSGGVRGVRSKAAPYLDHCYPPFCGVIFSNHLNPKPMLVFIMPATNKASGKSHRCTNELMDAVSGSSGSYKISTWSPIEYREFELDKLLSYSYRMSFAKYSATGR